MEIRAARAASLFAVLLAVTASTSPASAQKATVHESPHKKLSNSCEECHVATSFRDIRFEHSRTGFPLDGHHRRADCLECHSVADFSLVENTCGTCHEDVHRARSRVPGAQGWAVFDAEGIHASTNFPLMGRHTSLDCESCHRGMRVEGFQQTATECVGCHRDDYMATTSPDHAAGGFSTECQTCHNVLGWTPASMVDHDPIFPIFSGSHRGRWDACADCHIVPNHYATVSCIDCHSHSQSLTDPIHQAMNGYAYTTQACLSCHPRGEAGQFRDHDTVFPIYSGKHRGEWNDCAICHPTPTNKQVFTCIECHEHSQQRMDDKHLGEVNNYTFTPTSCYDCHPDGRKGN